MYNGDMHQENAHLATRQNYDRLSRWYDSFSSGERNLSKIALELLKIQPGENVLELGFGTGHVLLNLAQAAGESGSVTGIDISPGMLAIANRRVQNSGLAGTVTLQVGDATQLLFPDKQFHVAFISFTLELFENSEIPLVLAECRRVLLAGGRLGIVSLQEKESFMVSLYKWFHNHFAEVVDCRPIAVHQVIEAAGFEIIQTLGKNLWGLPVEIVIAKCPEEMQ
jgi:demethylmenaquinone methyltransferase/2-methoxy-6-polyprenyl-1,4-benzoquinol methylase